MSVIIQRSKRETLKKIFATTVFSIQLRSRAGLMNHFNYHLECDT